VRITAVRKLAAEAADNGLLAPELASGTARIKGLRARGIRCGNWLSIEQAQALLNAPDTSTLKGLRDRAMFAVLLGCALRRSEGRGAHDQAPTGSGRTLVHCRSGR
jgi:site-specific recombinase XerC